MVSLGFSVGHDKGCVIIVDGEVKVGISQERLTRVKHDGGYSTVLPVEAIDYCLQYLGLEYSDVDRWTFNTVEDDDVVADSFEKTFGIDRSRLHFIPHHLAHAYSTFYSSGFSEAAVVVADAMGSVLKRGSNALKWFGREWPGTEDYEYAEGITIYKFAPGEDKEVYKKWIKYPMMLDGNSETSIGEQYGKGSLQLVYDPKTNSWPAGKLMGLASYADQEWVKQIPSHTTLSDSEIFIPSVKIMPEVDYRSDFYSKANVAGLYQRDQEQNSIHLVGMAKRLTGSENVCVAGGSFLNCNTNEMIIKSGLYKDQYFVPCSDDSGIPLGCAWWGYVKSERAPKGKYLNPYMGRSYSDLQIKDAIDKASAEFEFGDLVNVDLYRDKSEQIRNVASIINQNKVIGLFQGGSEIGPRALGNRSIIASPKCVWMKDHINHDIKLREWYRPFAPSVLFDRQKDVFDLDVYSPYMMVTARVKEEWKSRIPSVVHIDGTSRYQSVTKESNPYYHRLISEFESMSGIPLVLNTSFNGPDEPIVESPYHAIRTFWKRNLHALCIGNYVITRKPNQ